MVVPFVHTFVPQRSHYGAFDLVQNLSKDHLCGRATRRGSREERLRLPLGGRVTSWDSSGVSVTPVGVESPAGDSTGRRVSALPSGTDPRTVQGAPSQEPAQIGKVKLFPADRGHPIPAPEWEGCRVSSARSAFRFCACWSLWLAGPGPLSLLVASRVVPGFSGRVFGNVLKWTGAPTPKNVHFCQVCPGNCCNCGYWQQDHL